MGASDPNQYTCTSFYENPIREGSLAGSVVPYPNFSPEGTCLQRHPDALYFLQNVFSDVAVLRATLLEIFLKNLHFS
jgi:hypothetical protein